MKGLLLIALVVVFFGQTEAQAQESNRYYTIIPPLGADISYRIQRPLAPYVRVVPRRERVVRWALPWRTWQTSPESGNAQLFRRQEVFEPPQTHHLEWWREVHVAGHPALVCCANNVPSGFRVIYGVQKK